VLQVNLPPLKGLRVLRNRGKAPETVVAVEVNIVTTAAYTTAGLVVVYIVRQNTIAVDWATEAVLTAAKIVLVSANYTLFRGKSTHENS
jgi:hypothetical protein